MASAKETQIFDFIDIISDTTQEIHTDYLLVKKPTLVKILSQIDPTKLIGLEAAIQFSSQQPPLHSEEWLPWYLDYRKNNRVSREMILKEIPTLDKGDLSKFESGKLPFGIKRKKDLLKALESSLSKLSDKEFI